MMLRMAVLALAAALLIPHAALAQATLDIPLGDQAERRIARLIALGLVDTAMVGQRPFTRREGARMVESARRNFERSGGRRVVAELLIASLERELADPLEARLLDRGRMSARATNAAPRPYPEDGLGGLDAWLSPTIDARGMEPMARGGVLLAGTRHSFRGARWLVAEARPRLAISSDVRDDADRPSGIRGGPDRAPVFDIEAGYLRGSAGSFVIDIGRSEMAIGQSAFASMGIAESAPPLTMVRVSNDRAIHIPLFSRVFGPARGTVFVADLGADQNFPHAKLAGWKLNALPHRRLELGVGVLSHQGGGGAPPATFSERVLDLLPIYDAAIHRDGDIEISNKMSGIEFRFRSPWRDVNVYGEIIIDDADPRRWASTFWEEAGYVVGTSAPIGYSDGRLTLTAEAQHTGIRYYRHGDFTSGWSTRGRLIGNPLGPNGNAGYLRLTLDRGAGAEWEVDAAHEFRSGRRYVTSGGYDDETLRFHLTAKHPAEYRQRVVLRTRNFIANRYPWARDLRTLAEGGVELVRNEGHAEGRAVRFVLRLGTEILF